MHFMTHRVSHRHSDHMGGAIHAAGGRALARGRKGRRILIVEDHFALRQHLGVLLQALEPDCQVVDTGTLSDARRLLATTPVDGLLVDVRLPDGSGLDFAGEFRAANPEPPIVVMSAFDAIELRTRVDRVANATFVRKFDVGDKWRALLVDLLNRRLPASATRAQ